MEDEYLPELNLNMQDRRLRLTLDLARTLIGFPGICRSIPVASC